MDARLPPVPRDYLEDKKNPKGPDRWATAPWGVPDDPNELHSYARGLWEQWQALERRDGTARKRYSKETVKAAVLLLTDAYVDAAWPIPYELSRLMRAIIKPKANASSSPVQARSERAYGAAILFEATGSHSIYAVAKHLRASDSFPPTHSQKTVERMVRGWRELDHYKENVQLYRRLKQARPVRTD